MHTIKPRSQWHYITIDIKSISLHLTLVLSNLEPDLMQVKFGQNMTFYLYI